MRDLIQSLKIQSSGRPLVLRKGNLKIGYIDQTSSTNDSELLQWCYPFLMNFKNKRYVTKGFILVIKDVTSLCSNIPYEEIMQACKISLRTRVFQEYNIKKQNISNIIQFIATHNVQSNDHNFLQVRITGMGIKLAPSYETLFIDALEWEILSRYYFSPLNCNRYMNNIFLIWTHDFKTHHNYFPNTRKFTMEYCTISFPLLYVLVGLNNNHIYKTLYTKTTYAHCHPIKINNL